MNPLNRSEIEGNLTKDPTFRNTPGGTLICSLSIAVNRYYGKGENKEQETSFFDVEAWVSVNFLTALFSGNLDLIFDELDRFLDFLEKYSLYLGNEKYEYFEILDLCFEIIEKLYF